MAATCPHCGAPLVPIDPVFDMDRHEIVGAGERRPVRATPWRVILFLAERRGRLVTRAQLYEELWPVYTLEPAQPATLNAHIFHARRALAGTRYRIDTVIGAGWRFEAGPATQRLAA